MLFRRDERQDRLQSPSYKKTRLTYDLLNQWMKFLVSLELGICFRATLLILCTNLYHQSLAFGEQPLVSDSCEERPGKRHSKVSLACSWLAELYREEQKITKWCTMTNTVSDTLPMPSCTAGFSPESTAPPVGPELPSAPSCQAGTSAHSRRADTERTTGTSCNLQLYLFLSNTVTFSLS